jgi:hypothetical protein
VGAPIIRTRKGLKRGSFEGGFYSQFIQFPVTTRLNEARTFEMSTGLHIELKNDQAFKSPLLEGDGILKMGFDFFSDRLKIVADFIWARNRDEGRGGSKGRGCRWSLNRNGFRERSV